MNCARLTVLSALLIAFTAAHADSVTKQIEANYASIATAFQHNDIKAISAFLTPEYQMHDAKGASYGRDKVLADFKSQMAVMKDVKWVRKITKLVRQGNVATATVDGQFKGILAVNGQPARIVELTSTTKDEWQTDGKKWLLKSSTSIKRSITIDGNPVKM